MKGFSRMAIDKNGSINVASITCTENSSTDIFAFLSDSPPSTESMPHYDDGDIFSWLSSSDSITFSTAKTTEADRNLLGMQTNCFANASVVPCSQYAQTIFGNSLFGVKRYRTLFQFNFSASLTIGYFRKKVSAILRRNVSKRRSNNNYM